MDNVCAFLGGRPIGLADVPPFTQMPLEELPEVLDIRTADGLLLYCRDPRAVNGPTWPTRVGRDHRAEPCYGLTLAVFWRLMGVD